jgi:hypothetical protein
VVSCALTTPARPTESAPINSGESRVRRNHVTILDLSLLEVFPLMLVD